MRCLCLALASSLFVIACGGSTGGTGQMDAPPLSGDKYSLTWGPVTVQPGVENTQCILARLSNPTDIMVHQMHNVISTGSHHMIVYKDDMDTAEQLTPFDCQPFTGALNQSGMVTPLMITQKSDDELTLPTAVAHHLAANQMIRIELHYINTTDAAEMVTGSADFFAADPATIKDEANILFIGTPDISLPPGVTTTVEEFFTPSRANVDLSSSKIFAITGHTHHFGTDMQVGTAASNGATQTPVYSPNPFVWSEPLTQVHDPEFSVPTGAGFDFKCVYNNTGTTTVKFGESATDEMCFFWMYYYPSQGSHVCFHSNQYGVDVCCPDAGTICNNIKF
jgi:hypothetical protein